MSCLAIREVHGRQRWPVLVEFRDLPHGRDRRQGTNRRGNGRSHGRSRLRSLHPLVPPGGDSSAISTQAWTAPGAGAALAGAESSRSTWPCAISASATPSWPAAWDSTSRVIRRMLDPEHATKAEKIQAALAVLGKQMTVEVATPRKAPAYHESSRMQSTKHVG